MKTILVIDDEPMLRDMIAEILNTTGWRVLTARHGEDGLRLLNREKVDLLITDLFMPGKDGLEVIRECVHSHPDLPIVAMTGGGARGINPRLFLEMAGLLGAGQLLSKPFLPDELLKLVHNSLGSWESRAISS